MRYQVFGEEMGAKLKGAELGLDRDEFDPHCQHLLVRESESGRVVGCTWILSDENARRVGRFYAESEFDLSPIHKLPGRKLEVGRVCIAEGFRQGAGIAVLWSGLAGFIQLHYLPPFDGQALDRGEIARRCRLAIVDALAIDPSLPSGRVEVEQRAGALRLATN